MYEVQYVPLALTFFLFLVGLFLFIVVLIQLHVLQYVYAKLGLSTGAALVVERESQCSRPRLAPEGMTLKVAPSFAEFPLYNADIQHSSAFLAPVNISPKLFELPMGSSSSRPRIIFQSGRLEERHRLGVPAVEPTLCWQAYRAAISIAWASRGSTRSIRSA